MSALVDRPKEKRPRVVNLDLRNAPSSMELIAASWAAKAAGKGASA